MIPLLFIVTFCIACWYSYKHPVKSYVVLLIINMVVPPTVGFGFGSLGVGIFVTFARIYFLAFVLVYIITVRTARSTRNLVETQSDIILVVLIMYLIASTFWGISRAYNLKTLLSERWLLSFVAYFIAKDIIRDSGGLVVLFRGVFLSLLVILLYGLIELVGRRPIMSFPIVQSLSLLTPDRHTSLFTESFDTRGGFIRITGTYWNTIIYGIAITFLYPIIIMLSRLRIRYSVTCSYVIPIVAVCTISRTALFSLILAIVLNFKVHMGLAIAVCIIFLVALPYLNSVVVTDGYTDDRVFSMRSRVEQVVLPVLEEMRFDRLLFGYGVGAFQYIYETGDDSHISRSPGDNSLFQTVFCVGFVGAGIMLLFFLAYYMQLNNYLQQYGDNVLYKQIIIGCKTVIVIQMLIFCISNSLFQDCRLSFVFFSILGAISGTMNSERFGPRAVTPAAILAFWRRRRF